MTLGFIWLRDLSDGQFLFGYAISMTVGFAGLRDLNDGWILVLLGYEILMTVGFILFYLVTRSQ